MPSADWSKDGKKLSSGDNIEMMRSPEMCRLKLKSAKRSDRGEYELELKNNSGSVKVPVTIKVLGKWCDKGLASDYD